MPWETAISVTYGLTLSRVFKIRTKMNVIVNGKEIVLFEGAKVKDALASFSPNEELADGLTVLDAFGNEVDCDGALRDGSRLFVRTTVRKKTAK